MRRPFGTLLTSLFLLLFTSVLHAERRQLTLYSPNHKIEFRLTEMPDGLRYSVFLRGKPVITDSAIGITIDGADVARGAEIGTPSR
ncbi:MAG: hypothetical protein WCC14_17950, partial [Acidobacteriaceae bacterium]